MDFDTFLETQNDLARDAAYALLNALVGCDVTVLADDEEPAVEEDLDSIESLTESAEGVLDEMGMGDMICRPFYSLQESEAKEEKRIPCYQARESDPCGCRECPYLKLLEQNKGDE